MKVSTIQKYEGKSISQLLKLATTHFNKYIRNRDSDSTGYGVCISSGQPLRVPSSNSHAGHFYSAGKYPELRYNEDNVHLQGKSDNYFNGGNLLEYRKRLINKIGIERVEQLDQTVAQSKRTIHKWCRFYLVEVIETYKQKSKEVEKHR